MLAKAEPRVAKVTGYQVKFVEKPGKSLCNMFPKEISQPRCYRESCAVCINSTSKHPTRCQQKGVVYFGICKICDAKFRAKESTGKVRHEGLYVGETSRTLSERAHEHRLALDRLDDSSFIVKHWSTKHSDMLNPPEFEFKVVQKHQDALGRLVHEAIKIPKLASLN